MCTSLTLSCPDGTQLFGRTLDWHEHFHEKIIRTPQGFSGNFGRCTHAMLGMGTEADGYPLYADGMNECGLCMAGLRFAQSAHYMPATATPPEGVLCLAPWELIPYVLGLCATLDEAREALGRGRVIDRPFSLAAGGTISNAPLHWHVSDCRGASLVVEATARGLELHDAPLGVMANDPAYPEQVTAYEQSLGMGEDVCGYTSTARFIRAALLRERYARKLADGEGNPVTAFFEMAGKVSPPVGAVPAVAGVGWQTTLYTACMDGARRKYFYTTAEHPDVQEAGM